jgi:hypothetical protein
MAGKWLGLLKQIAPRVARVAIVFNPTTAPYANYYLAPFKAAAMIAMNALGGNGEVRSSGCRTSVAPHLAKFSSVFFGSAHRPADPPTGASFVALMARLPTGRLQS